VPGRHYSPGSTNRGTRQDTTRGWCGRRLRGGGGRGRHRQILAAQLIERPSIIKMMKRMPLLSCKNEGRGRESRHLVYTAFAVLLSGCVTPMPLDRQEKLDGLLVYGLVNVAPSAELTTARLASTQAKQSCMRYADEWCRDPGTYTFASLLLMNTYSGGLRSVGVFAPKSAKIAKGDIVVAKLRQSGTGEFVRVASIGETSSCQWVGGGPTRALTAAGVVCEQYDWRIHQGLFYN
jgi:hypothetical protein